MAADCSSTTKGLTPCCLSHRVRGGEKHRTEGDVEEKENGEK